MIRKTLALMIFMASFFAASAANADPRIKTRTYRENAVYSLTGHLGFQTVIEFNDDETIENVAIGDSVAWQVTPNRRGDVIILKPISAAPPTNMTVVTSLRHYIFELESKAASDAVPGEMVFVLRFRYPQAAITESQEILEPAPPPSPELRATNRNYSYEGDRQIVPSKIFDDGRSTYFQWAEGAPAPAIFAVDKDDNESVINHGFESGFVVVDRVAPVFLLKHGALETRVYNDAFVPIDPGPDAPRLRPAERGFFGRLFGGDGEGE
ncbi:MAG: TrbG/VirB9 family P-type conjugative transfer protein [Pseudomonadota bacterium]